MHEIKRLFIQRMIKDILEVATTKDIVVSKTKLLALSFPELQKTYADIINKGGIND